MKLEQPPVETEWLVARCFLVDYPPSICSDSLKELRVKIAELARKANVHREPKRRIRSLEFHYLLDDQEYVTEVRVFFKGFKNTIRLMKLVRMPANAS